MSASAVVKAVMALADTTLEDFAGGGSAVGVAAGCGVFAFGTFMTEIGSTTKPTGGTALEGGAGVAFAFPFPFPFDLALVSAKVTFGRFASKLRIRLLWRHWR